MKLTRSSIKKCIYSAVFGGCVASGLLVPRPSTMAWGDDETTYYDNGQGYLGQKKYAEAEAEFRKSIHADPRYKRAWQALADALKADGKPDQAAAAQKMADAAPENRSGPAPALTDDQKAALGEAGDAPAGNAPAPAPATTQTAVQDGTFDDVSFATPDPKVWSAQVTNDNLVFSVALPPPDFCTITVFASKDFAGDAKAFAAAFDAAVDADQKAKGTVKIEKDGGDKPSKLPKDTEVISRSVYSDAKDFHTRSTYVGVHVAGRFELIAYQSSGDETFKQHGDDAQQFLSSLSFDVKREVK